MADIKERLNAALAGRYTIERELGHGGMATVFLAEDLKHHRRVAVKVLDAELARAIGPQRFLREIEIAASLEHPHILPLFDSGQADGLLFYVMPYLQGESLRGRLEAERQLPIDEALKITRELAEALSCAHGRGIVHRDVKPENVMFSGAHALLADFGIARGLPTAETQRLTSTGVTMGTPAYMSPEQAVGLEDVDAKGDQYALACVVYEMLAGQPPFTGPTAESIAHQHLAVPPHPVTELRPAVPKTLAKVVARGLAKSPADRFASVLEFSAALEAAARTPDRPEPWWRRHPIWSVALALAAVSVVVTATFLLHRQTGRIESLAVLPLSNLSGDPGQDYFADGMTDALIAQLGKVHTLKVVSRYSVMQYKGSKRPLPEIARALGVDALVTGAAVRSGDRVRVTAELVKAEDNRQMWSDSYERDFQDVLALQAALASAIVRQVRVTLRPEERAGFEAARTVDPAAYDAYLRGMKEVGGAWGVDGFRKGMRWYEESIARDSTFAPAWSGLAECLSLLTNFGAPDFPPMPTRLRAVSAARRAVALDSTLARGYASLYVAQADLRIDLKEDERLLRHALDLDPNLTTALSYLAELLASQGRSDEALRLQRRAAQLDPEEPMSTLMIGVELSLAGRYDEAIDFFRTQRRRWPDQHLVYQALGMIYTMKGDPKRGVAELDTALTLSGNTTFLKGIRGWILARAGRTDEARRVLAELTDASKREYVLPIAFAYVHAGLGDRDEAFRWLNRSVDEHAGFTFLMKVDLPLRTLHSDPRWPPLLARIGLTP